MQVVKVLKSFKPPRPRQEPINFSTSLRLERIQGCGARQLKATELLRCLSDCCEGNAWRVAKDQINTRNVRHAERIRNNVVTEQNPKIDRIIVKMPALRCSRQQVCETYGKG